ncbi:MAG TPA: zinc-dependent peptidase [Saprospiraceae bacterium]|nr:zinc-dependent peptidase [Saprospiraceae bacterium]
MSKRIMILSGLGLAVSAYFIFFQDRDDLVYLAAICLVVLVLAYTFHHQIDQLMIRGVPQKLDHAMHDMLVRTSPKFAQLTPEHQHLTEDRMERWVMKKDFINKNEPDAPEDAKYILAFYAVMLTLHQAEFLYEDLDRVAFYHHPFLSPHHPDDAHIAEVEMEDGTMIISVPHLIKGYLEKGYYNIGLHLMAEAFQQVYLKKKMAWPADIWDKLEAISGINRDRIEAYIGLPVDDPWPVAVHHQFTYADAHIEEVTHELPQLIHFNKA